MIDPLVAGSVVYGCLLAIMCLGLTVTYQTTKVPNFACADFAVMGMNAAYFSYVIFRLSTPYLAIPLALLGGGAFAVLMYALVMRPLMKRGSSIVVLMVASLAVDILFTGVQADIAYVGFAAFRNAFVKAGYPTLLSPPQLPDFSFLGLNGLLIVSPIALAVIASSMFLLLTRSKFGIAMRAAIESPDLARIVGINVDRVYVVSWFIAGALAGVAGSMYTMWSGTYLGIQNILIIDIFAGSVLGGLSSIYGAIIGAVIIATSENSLLGALSSALGSGALVLEYGGISMMALIITLLVAPTGLVTIRWRRLLGARLRRR